MDFSQHFNQVHLSDVTLCLKTTVDAPYQQEEDDLASSNRKRAYQTVEGAPPSTGSERSYFLHKIILCQSPYFKNKLKYEEEGTLGGKPPDEKRARNSSASNALAASTSSEQVEHVEECEDDFMELFLHAKKQAKQLSTNYVSRSGASSHLVEHVEECELGAMELLLKSLYKADHELPEEARGNGQLLLQVYRLAEIYLPPDECLKPITTALSAFNLRYIDLALLSHVYSLPTGLLEKPSLQKFIASCKKVLLELFRDVPSIITEPERRQRFCALPFAAVLAWLQSDDLKVHSESCVLFLLSAWVNSKEHPACSHDQQKQLAHSVRVSQLSPTYLHSVLPDLLWFQESCCWKERKLMRALHMKSAHVGASFLGWDGPAAWIADGRKGTALPTSVCLEWNLGVEDITTIDELPPLFKIISPIKAYFNGIFYELLVQKVRVSKDDPAIITLGVYFRVASGSMSQVLKSWDPFEQPCVLRAELWAANKMHVLHGVQCKAGIGRGLPNLLRRSGATIANVVAPSLVEGRLNLKAVIKA